MTVTIEAPTKTDKQHKFDVWLEALRSGEYVQVKEALRVLDQTHDVFRYCCVGVLDEVVYKTNWYGPPKPDNKHYIVYHDDEGEDTLMSPDRVQDMELDKFITNDERDYFADRDVGIQEREASRLSALALMNDNGASFEDIADIVEELEWNL